MSNKDSKRTGRRKPRAIDLFSGCGGLTLGLKQAGFKVLGAVECDGLAANTYRKNHPDVVVKLCDIRKVPARSFMRELKLKRGDLDLLAGCPPCQGFSSLRTKNGAAGNKDRRNGLVKEMLRFVRAFRPKVLMMENVPALVRQKLFSVFCSELRKLGYQISFEIKDAANFGVPQRRRRLILLASRNMMIKFAQESKRFKTVRGAIGRLAKVGKGRDKLHNLPEGTRSKKIIHLIRDIPKDGGSRLDLPLRRQLDCHKRRDGFYDIYGRMAWGKVAPTITGGCFNPSKGRFLHPEENRAITMREAALLQSFPVDYFFDAGRGKEAIALMIGNALPPEFIRRHALEISRALKVRKAGHR